MDKRPLSNDRLLEEIYFKCNIGRLKGKDGVVILISDRIHLRAKKIYIIKGSICTNSVVPLPNAISQSLAILYMSTELAF